MSMMQLNTSERMLLTLLKASLHNGEVETAPFLQATADDWKQCYQLAARQGVMALAWDAVVKLEAGLQPPKPLKLSWAMAVETYEKKYARYCRTVNELSNFYADNDIVTVQMKGVGFSSYYPIPSHREGGDIDIFTYSADRSNRSDMEANRMADDLMQEQGYEVDNLSSKHSNFYYQGIPIENHKTFLNVELYASAVPMNELLHRIIAPTRTELLSGKYSVLTPSAAFNTVFIAYHAAQHYGSGLALHHLCDWACILIRHGLQLPVEVTDKGFLRMIAALTELCNRYLGTSIPTPVDAGNEPEIMLDEMLHPRYAKVVPHTHKWKILTYKTGRLLYGHRLRSRVLPRSLSKHLWESIKNHIRRPKTIFGRGEK